MFGSGWQAGEATIVERMNLGTGSVGNAAAGAVSVYKYVADVKVEGSGEVFRTTLEEPRLMPMFRSPGVGEVVKVKANPKKGEAKFDKSDPTISLDAQSETIKGQEKAAFDQALSEGATSDGSAQATSAGATAGAIERMLELDKLRESGAISDEAYAAEKAKIQAGLR